MEHAIPDSGQPESSLEKAGAFLFRYRNALFPVAALLLLLPGPRIAGSLAVALLLGALVALAGQIVRAVTIGLQYIVRGGRGGKVYADGLVTEGIYGLCRNPMYVGNVLIILGLGIASNSWTAFALVAALALYVYAAIVATEEAFLRGKFGAAYAEYCAQVPRWLPRPREVSTMLTGGQFHWRRVIVKEFGTPFGWICILCLTGLYHAWRQAQDPVLELDLVAVLAFASVLWFTARTMKKRRWLVAD